MSITYEEALETLESMFGEPWDREHLDLVLRHFQGHMENTVEAILAHGEQPPAQLMTNLKSGKETAARDLELARQLAKQERSAQQQQLQQLESLPAETHRGRGIPVQLPSDFLRIPGYTYPSSTPTNSAGAIDQDEALARMLQNQLFSQELANNPEFAHLANGGRRPQGIPRSSTMSRPSSASNNNQPPPIMDHITELGHDAKKRLQLFAAQWNTGVNKLASRLAGNTPTSAGAGAGVPVNNAAANETRGLLDDNNDDQNEEMEMSFATKNK